MINNFATYLGTANPSTSLQDTLKNVEGFLDSVDSQRQNVFAFLQAQDSWTQTEIDQILAADGAVPGCHDDRGPAGA